MNLIFVFVFLTLFKNILFFSTPDNNLNNQKKTQFVKLQFDNNNSKLEQHNKVEKKRKDVINYWIEELSKVVPDVDQTKDTKNQKLRKAFDYIKGLKEKVETLILANTPEKQGMKCVLN